VLLRQNSLDWFTK